MDGAHEIRPEADVRREMPIHVIQMQPVNAQRFTILISSPRRIRSAPSTDGEISIFCCSFVTPLPIFTNLRQQLVSRPPRRAQPRLASTAAYGAARFAVMHRLKAARSRQCCHSDTAGKILRRKAVFQFQQAESRRIQHKHAVYGHLRAPRRVPSALGLAACQSAGLQPQIKQAR